MIKLRKLLACLMIACMAFSLMPLAAFATEGEPCTHVWQDGGGKHVCSVCSEEAAHSFEEGVCTVCGAEEPADPNAEAANNAPAEPADEEGGAAEETYAAQIGENGYATLAEALAAMQDGDTVTLLKDVEESFTLETNGTIDLNNKTLIGEIIIKADVVFRTGEIAQKSGQAAAAVVLINSGSLKLEDTYINAGEYGGILVDSAETVSVELAGTVTSSQYGIMQSESSTGTLNVTSDPASGISGTKYGIYIRNGSYTARTTDEDTNDLNVRSNGTAIKIDKGSLSISGDKGSFEGALEIAEGVICSITGGSFTVKPNVDSGYLAVYDESTKFYNVVPGDVVNGVTVSVNVTGDSAPVTAADGITAPSGAASFACDSSAIDVQKLLAASKLTFLEGDVVSIELIPAVKIEAIEQTKNSVDSIEYSISPKAKITVTREGTEQKELEKELSVSNDMLKGGVDVTIPTVDGFTVLTQIVHIHSDGSTEEITKHSFGNNEVSFNVSSFSSFILYRSSMAIEVLDSNGKFSARYSSFSDALSAISGSSGWTIKLLQDVSIEAGNEYSYALAWKLDLAGKTLSTNSFYVYGTDTKEQSITIMDSSAAKSGKVVGTGTAATIDIGPNSVLTLESGTIEHTGGSAAVRKNTRSQVSAQLIIKGGTVKGAPAVEADACTVTIEDGTIISTGTAIDPVTKDSSDLPAILVNDNVNMTISGGRVTNTNSNGVAVSINGTTLQFTMSGGTVNGSAKGIDMYGGTVQINNGAISGATAINSVGGSITITGGTLDSTDTNATQEVMLGMGSTTVAISGGSFKHEVPKVQCADGYVPCADAKNPGRFSVEPISEPVARAEDALGVDKGTFSTVQDAINAAGLGGKVTLLRDNGDYATVSRSIVIDGAGCRMKNLTVMSIAGVKIMNLRADTVTVSANAKAELSGENVFTELVNNGALCEIIDGRYLSHTGSGTYAISGGVFGNEVTQDECALVPVTGKLTGTAASLTKYTPALNTAPETKDAYPYTVEVAPAPRITGISNNAYFQKGSSSTLTIYTDGDYDELVKAGTIYRCLHVYNANGTDLISSRYYTVEEDANGYAVITIANSFLRNRPTGTYSVQVDFTTGVTQLEDFRVGTSATPKTGDESNIGLWIGIMACSAIIIGCGVFVLVHKNKKNKK